MDDGDSYRYRRLRPGEEDIRLLEVKPSTADHNDTIVGHLRHFKLERLDDAFVNGSRKKIYRTLSYAWGLSYADGSHLSDMIICNDEPLRITAHLNQCLKRYRKDMHDRGHSHLLWVDAICINQGDLLEKNVQVQSMDRIYHSAQSAVVWLGEIDDDQSRVIEGTLGRLDKQPSALHDEWHVWRDLLDRSWFRRRWVLQEYALSTSTVFMLGSLTIQASELLTCMWRLGFRDEYDDLSQLKRPAATDGQTSGPIEAAMDKSLLRRLHQFHRSEYSHTLDCVYAIHSISADRHSIVVDYTKSMRDVNLEVAALYLSKWTTALPLLVSALMWRNAEYPSWLPDCNRSMDPGRGGAERKRVILDRFERPPSPPAPPHGPLKQEPDESWNEASTRQALDEDPFYMHNLGSIFEKVCRDDPQTEERTYVCLERKSHWHAPEIRGNRLQLHAFVYREVFCSTRQDTDDEGDYEIAGFQSGHALAGVHIEESGHCKIASPVTQSEAADMGSAETTRTLCLLRLTSFALVLEEIVGDPADRVYKVTDAIDVPDRDVGWWKNFLCTQEEIVVQLQ